MELGTQPGSSCDNPVSRQILGGWGAAPRRQQPLFALASSWGAVVQMLELEFSGLPGVLLQRCEMGVAEFAQSNPWEREVTAHLQEQQAFSWEASGLLCYLWQATAETGVVLPPCSLQVFRRWCLAAELFWILLPFALLRTELATLLQLSLHWCHANVQQCNQKHWFGVDFFRNLYDNITLQSIL